MRNAWPTYAVVLVAAVLVAVGCDSTQPDRVESRTASVSFRTTAKVDLYDCFEVWQDTSNPLDGTPDVNTGFISCEPTPPPQGGGTVVKAIRSIPWRYSVRISVIRKGTTTEEVVTSESGLFGSSVEPNDPNPFVSLTEFDETAPPLPQRPPADDIILTNGATVSLGNPTYLAFAGFDVGTPNILTQPLTVSPSFSFVVNTGDTVVVRARKQPMTEAPPFLHLDQDPEVILESSLAIGGTPVSTNGESASSTLDQSGFSNSFTVP